MQIITFAAFKLHSLSGEFIRQLLHYIQHYHVQQWTRLQHEDESYNLPVIWAIVQFN